MRIGLDIDNTMYNLNVVDQVSNLLGLDYKTENVKHWLYDKKSINGFPKYFTDLVFAYFDKSEYMCNLELYPGVRDKIINWHEKGHELYVISARNPSVQIETVQMLQRDINYNRLNMNYTGIDDITIPVKHVFKSIHFVEHKTNAKEYLFSKLKLDVWIDDNPIDIKKSCKLGIKVYGINNKYTQYNNAMFSYCKETFKNFKAVEGIKDIEL